MKPVAARELPRFDARWHPRELRGRSVVLVGLGTFGGGLGAARWLLAQGVPLTVTDLREESTFGDVAGQLRREGARLVLGRHDERDLDEAACVVASPAVPSRAPYLQAAALRGIPIETEISLLARLLPCPWIGVTGTNGKSTTAALTALALRTRFDRVFEGGNMGGSLLDQVSAWGADDRVVLELSSFQLEHLAQAGLGPDLAVVTNLSPDHLDRHGSMDDYAAAKQGILRRARCAVLPAAEPRMKKWAQEFSGEVLWFFDGAPIGRSGFSLEGEEWLAEVEGERRIRATCAQFALVGRHNRLNLLAAATAAFAFGARFEDAVAAGRLAQPLRSRMETIARVGGVRFVDDGVSTSPEAVVAALDSFDGTTHLLLGGYDKGLDCGPLLEEVTRRDVRPYLFGDVAADLGHKLREGSAAMGRQIDASPQQCGDLPTAFAAAASAARTGDVVLFSPGFASYDQFQNFTERVELFRSLVSRWRDLQSGAQ